MHKYNQKQLAFTIIEVVLVLAIAGLIFLMVFIALPALQRSQRDNQRKRDLSRAVDAIQRYWANNGGRLPQIMSTTSADFVGRYIAVDGEEFKDPDGSDYSFFYERGGTPHTERKRGEFTAIQNYGGTIPEVVRPRQGARCIDGGQTEATNNINEFALTIMLEGGGVYCLDN